MSEQETKSLPYRREALEHYETRQQETRLLRVAPTWTRHAYGFVLATFVAGVAFIMTARIRERAQGTALLRLHDRVAVTSPRGGRVSAVHVQPGDSVHAGDPLLEIEAVDERALAARLEEERFSATARFLVEPSDERARGEVASLRAREREAQSQREAKLIRAPRAGVVRDVRVREGQAIEVGSEVATVASEAAGALVTAAIPARFRPRLGPDQALRLRFPGLAHAYRDIRVRSVADEAIGPAEARRVLGPEVADAISLDEPVILVRGELRGLDVESADGVFRLHDGMLAQASVTLDRERLVFIFFPGLRRALAGAY